MDKIEPPYQPSADQYVEYIQAKLQKLVRAIDNQQEAVTELLSALEKYSNHLDKLVEEVNAPKR